MIQGNYGFSPQQYLGAYGQNSSQLSTTGSTGNASQLEQLQQLQQLIASLGQSSGQLGGQWENLLGGSSVHGSNGSIGNQFPPPPPFQGQNGQFGGQNGQQFPPPPPFQGQNGQFGGQNGQQFPPPPPFQGQNGQFGNQYDLASILKQLGIES